MCCPESISKVLNTLVKKLYAVPNYLARRGCGPGASFEWQDRTPLSKTRFMEAVKQALTIAHLPAQDYAGCSFRIRAATTAAMAGLENSAI